MAVEKTFTDLREIFSVLRRRAQAGDPVDIAVSRLVGSIWVQYLDGNVSGSECVRIPYDRSTAESTVGSMLVRLRELFGAELLIETRGVQNRALKLCAIVQF